MHCIYQIDTHTYGLLLFLNEWMALIEVELRLSEKLNLYLYLMHKA